jgi:hypothetical protein
VRTTPSSRPAGILLAATALAVGCSSGSAGRPVAPEAAVVPAPAAAVSAARFPASDVLRAWDRARSRAFAAGDVAALRRLYVPGSAAGTSDVRLLRRYLRRGLRVDGMRMQLLAVTVLARGPTALRVRVTDRLVGAVAVGHGVREPLPHDRASTRVVALRHAGDRWRVAWVRESSPRPAAGSASAPRR